MKPTILTPIAKEIIIEYTGDIVQLTANRSKEIEDFWLEVNQQGRFHRGEVFTVFSIQEQPDLYTVQLSRTDYAHYLHTVRNSIFDEESCKVIFAAGLVETSDSKFIFGEMNSHTAYPGRMQCVGGGLSWEDKVGNIFDSKQSVLRELSEELGITNSEQIESCAPVFIKTGGTYDFIVVLYHIKLRFTAEELLLHYQQFIDHLLTVEEKPEFQNLIVLDNTFEAINRFFQNENRYCVDYLEPFLVKTAEEN